MKNYSILKILNSGTFSYSERGYFIMKKQKHRISRCVAALAACAMMTAAMPIAQISVSAADLISNGTFETSTSGWGMYKESGGAASLSSDNGRLALKISNTGKVTYAVQMFYDIIRCIRTVCTA